MQRQLFLSTLAGSTLPKVDIGYIRATLRNIQEGLDFKAGKCWPNDRPGLGVTREMSQMSMIGGVTAPGKVVLSEKGWVTDPLVIKKSACREGSDRRPSF